MKFMVFALSCVLMIFSPMAALAADIAGQWTAQTLMSPSGSEQAIATTFTFQAEGNKLTGTVENERGKYEILNGKVEGDSVTFGIRVPDGNLKFSYDGVMTDAGIEFIVKVEDRDRSDYFVAQRRSE